MQLTLEADHTAPDSPDTLAMMKTPEKQLRDKRANERRRKNVLFYAVRRATKWSLTSTNFLLQEYSVYGVTGALLSDPG